MALSLSFSQSTTKVLHSYGAIASLHRGVTILTEKNGVAANHISNAGQRKLNTKRDEERNGKWLDNKQNSLWYMVVPGSTKFCFAFYGNCIPRFVVIKFTAEVTCNGILASKRVDSNPLCDLHNYVNTEKIIETEAFQISTINNVLKRQKNFYLNICI